ncbi:MULTISPECIES: hypothetical protein [Pimelobacter]|uniref:hypothetical protein n=1 Tax=Pimelobacter TaxID=2044 RepID=UPI001C0599A2|nr:MULTISPECIES: hypothetical protein [Pimelobacter]MBU2696851.1 hypothetical protein [Pimelobacter sp. 30-1]UUW87327.1 hypothetical protein M0M43_16415 [Pimelobacter simplex]UUW96833.1 hypothetical protein M0M48_05060 [Pimelobacter simplex]
MVTRRPTFTEIVDWIEGRLPDERADQVAAEVAADEDSAGAAAWMTQFLADARRLPLETPPPELSARLRGLFDDAANLPPEVRWATAHLLYDTREAMTGTRSADLLDHTHLAFETEHGRFVVEVRRAGAGEVDLHGLLLLDEGAAAADVTLLEDGTVRRRARTTADGRFELLQVPQSVDELRIAVRDARVSAPLDLTRA